MTLARSIAQRIRAVTGMDKVPLHEPDLTGNELAYVSDCIQTGWVSSVGGYVDRFERELAAFTGAGHAVVVSNGTSGLQVALRLVGVTTGDEVLIPALTFIATANAVSHCGATPHFVDSGRLTLGMDPEALASWLTNVAERRSSGSFNRRTGRRLAAIVPMHTFGHPVDMPSLLTIAAAWGIPVVEDAAESLGSMLEGRHVGTFGRCAVLSFNGNKILTTGGGGAILTNDPDLARRAKHLTTTAKIPHPWAFWHDEIGFNYRMPNINAAIGCAQLERMDEFIACKRALTERYLEAFRDLLEVEVFVERHGTRSNYWLQTLILAPSVADQRDDILKETNAAGQMTRPVWEPISALPIYAHAERAPLPVTEDLARRIINIPSSPKLAMAM